MHFKRKIAHAIDMITLFLRAILLYLAVFAIIRLTGKRQVSDLQPFDLLITLLIADLAGCAITDVDTPLVYSIVPMLGLYLIQQLVTWICLKSAHVRRVVCGSPVILVREGHVNESAMRDAGYTLIDLMDQLRAKDAFRLDEVAYAILETNGSMSVLLNGEKQTPTREDLSLRSEPAALCYMLVLDGRLCHDSLSALSIAESKVLRVLKDHGVERISDVFFLHRAPDGTMSMQLKERAGGERAVWHV